MHVLGVRVCCVCVEADACMMYVLECVWHGGADACMGMGVGGRGRGGSACPLPYAQAHAHRTQPAEGAGRQAGRLSWQAVVLTSSSCAADRAT